MDELKFLDGKVRLFSGDCREVLRETADNSVDSVVTDPPYHLTTHKMTTPQPIQAKYNDGKGNPYCRPQARGGFMGKRWDGGDIAFQTALWGEVLRVLKPGGYIMAFSSCRTYHRMACAIEDAGFVTHPMFCWAFGSGFPKAHNLSKQLDKMAGIEPYIIGQSDGGLHRGNGSTVGSFTGLHAITAPATAAAREWDGWFYGTQSCKPAIEPVYFGQKPFERGLNGAQNVLKWGVGAINVGACKIPSGTEHMRGVVRGTANGVLSDIRGTKDFVATDDQAGRWPANLIHDGSDEVLACFPETTSGEFTKRKTSYRGDDGGSWNNVPTDCDVNGSNGGDSGSAARFFKSFPQESYEEIVQLEDSVKRLIYMSKADSDDRIGSKHPTVKPLDLIQYLARLITPPKGVCLDLFAGTGTTAEACFREGFRAILIENDPESITDIERRMSLVMEGPDIRAYASAKARGRPRDDGPLFAGVASE